MKSTVLLYLAGAALAAPTRTIEKRQLGDLGALSSLLPSSGSSGLGGLSNLGSSSSGGLGGLSSLIPSSGGSGLDALESLIPSSSGGLSGLSGLGALESLIPSSSSGLGESGSSSGIGALESLIPSGSSSLEGLGGLTGSSGSSSGLGALSSLIPSVGSLTKRQSGSITQNGVTENSGCEELTFIFARGSDEMGNMGSVVGPEVATQLNSLTGNKVTVQGVTYTATAESNVAMGSNGGPIMANLVEQALKQCPDTKVVLGGYSQGAMVVHNAANRLTATQVAGAVLFGDPFKAEAVGKLSSSKVKEFCASGDPVCENGFNVMAHLSYGSDANEAAQFLIQAAGISASS
ncbi:hypothetical protein N7462_009588 [Penicillium macrosclerotiorum]|uniref:uncharacterized protein n=1 Tax=Penicillium macrosclerotiorum TaxID=303699 RepID=UPI002546E54E|nr:uncharacterized protein N7462_009588 [Penicillium macrosclerotiorum]KAJ5674149.1 hypothetical protein N7462_009588 [Penicillium macrosclerotiorum]